MMETKDFVSGFIGFLLAVLGASSKKLEEFFKNKILLIKIFMFILFLGLGALLLVEI